VSSINLRPNKLTLYKRPKSPLWQCRYKLHNGEWYRQSTGTDDQAEAEDIAFKLYYGAGEREKNNLPQNTRKFGNVARYAATRMTEELDAGGGKVVYKDYIRVINNYLIPYFGKQKVDSINTRKLMEYASWRDMKMGTAKEEVRIRGLRNRISDYQRLKEELGKEPKPFKAKQSTINTHNSALNRVFDEALLRGWITDSIKPTLLNKGIKTESRGAFSIDEYQAIYKGIPLWIKKGHRKETRELREVLREYVLFLANTGIRHGTEAISIKWSNIRYFTGLDKLVYLEVAVDGKVGKRKLVPRDNTARYLERLRDLNDSIKHLTLKELLSKQLDVEVFRTRSGYNPTTDALRGSFRQYLEQAGILRDTNGVTRSLYCLRHTYATFRLFSGTNIHQLATQMGTSVKMLETFYSKVSPQMNAAIHSGRLETIQREEQED